MSLYEQKESMKHAKHVKSQACIQNKSSITSKSFIMVVKFCQYGTMKASLEVRVLVKPIIHPSF